MSQQHESEETEQPASRLNDIQVVDTRTFPDFLRHEALLLGTDAGGARGHKPLNRSHLSLLHTERIYLTPEKRPCLGIDHETTIPQANEVNGF